MLKRVRLELAREPAFPNGDPHRGYEFVLPLDPSGRIDLRAWERHKLACTAHRFWTGEPDQVGQVVRTRGGGWAISYERGEDDDEKMRRLDSHVLKNGEYVSIANHDGQSHTFRIVSVTPALPPSR
jgi:hypothetical protein